MSLNQHGRQRRRGQALETALLDAAWAELADTGYDELTIDAVAARAQTSRAVLYRRWPSKQQLVMAALIQQVTTDVVETPQTGSLRGDMLALLRRANETRLRLATLVFTRLGGFYQDADTSLDELASHLQGGRPTVLDAVLRNAVERGEIQPGQVSDRVARVPVELFRYQLMATLRPVPDRAIEEIVDDVFLPLVRLGAMEPGDGRAHVDSAGEL